jgi:SSS family solute:Na+ symporter
VVSQSLGLSLTTSILLVGGGSVLYTSIGGMAADVWSDVLQLVWLWVGIAVASAYLLQQHGLALLAAVPAERMTALDARAWGGTPDSMFGLAPMLVGGFFLYLSYYGCDQSQAQRLLAARSDEQARLALLLNGLLRFPVVFTYCGLGVLLAGALALDPAFASSMDGQAPDRLVPIFMMSYLPSGLRGLFVAAIAAAAMSSIDSALNSLAAVTLEDVAGQQTRVESVWVGRGVSLAWGVFAVLSALAFARASSGVLELINQIGSVFYGPVLAVFLMGIMAPSVGANAMLRGFAIGLAVTAVVGWWAPAISWLWWNPIGFFAAAAGATSSVRGLGVRIPVTWRRREVVLLSAMFVGMLVLLVLAPLAPSMLFGTTHVAPSP